MGDYGIKVARTGFSALTAGVLDQVFNTSYNTMKTLSRGTASSTASGMRTIVVSTAAFRCGFMAWFEVSDNGKWYPCGTVEDYSGASVSVNAYVDNGFVLYADIYSSSSKAVVVKYILLADPGE